MCKNKKTKNGCVECPWKTGNTFAERVIELEDKRKTTLHRCHMLKNQESSLMSNWSSKTVCKGALEHNEGDYQPPPSKT